jgi:two-component system chemotaxis response regulator CheY
LTTANLIRSLSCGIHAGAPILRVVEQRQPTLPGTAIGEEDATSRLREKRRRVLVVDDEDLFREGLAFKLRNLYNANVEEAETGLIALDKVSAGRAFDLILMDVSMPDIGGDEACKEMRARGVDAPIVLMSAYGENRVLAQALGVPFLDKPFDEAILAQIFLRCGGDEVS